MQHPYRVFRIWIWEILSITFAIGLVSAIIAILVSYHGKEVPDWGVNLNINALLALLSTILRAMLVVVISQIICQQKWEWYGGEQARPLSDFQQFDSGSRGSFGALLLMPIVRLKDITTLIAAVVLVCSFLVGPFVQQASRTMVCAFPDQSLNASLPYAHYVPRQNGYAPYVRYPDAIPGADIVVAILSAVTTPDGVENQISASCSTGNCTFTDGDPKDSENGELADNDLTTHSTVGMCNTCINVTSLISRQVKPLGNATTLDRTEYTLPNGLNVSYWGPGSDFASIKPDSNLTWLGDTLTPELRDMSRWAYINATFLEGRQSSSVAATCVLYPCLRTYTASISNSQLSERLVRTEVMQVDMTNMTTLAAEDVRRSKNAGSNFLYHYATVKSPCRVDGKVYDMRNMSLYSGATKLSLYNFTEQGGSTSTPYTYRNITAPEQCIYRHHALFVGAISKELSDEIFDGYCSRSNGIASCSKHQKTAQLSTDNGMISKLGASTVLLALINGDVPKVTRWFDSFADTMSNRLRFEYGATDFKTSNRSIPTGNGMNRTLPQGQLQGVAWRDTTCVSLHWQWLLLPIFLTLITTLLAMKTIFTSWRHRHNKPVWKDSILPFIFYGHKIESQEPQTLTHKPSEQIENKEQEDTGKEHHLFEANEMINISRKNLITFRWPDHAQDKESNSSAKFPLQQSKSWLRRRSPQDKSTDPLLQTTGVQDQGASDIGPVQRNTER